MNWLKQIILGSAWLRNEVNSERAKIFALAQRDILETMSYDLDKQAEGLAREKLKKLLWLDIPEVVDIKGGTVYINGEIADPGRVSNLKAEADFFSASDLFKLLNTKLAEEAKKVMFSLGEDAGRQLATGRTILYTLDAQERAIKTIQNLSTPSPL